VAERIALPPQEIDLLQFQHGTKHLLFEGEVPAGSYEEARIVLADAEPVTLVLADGSAESVLVPEYHRVHGEDGGSGAADVRAVFGTLSLTFGEGTPEDVTMHIDLRKMLRPVDASLPAAWRDPQSDAHYWLAPENPTFRSATVGAVEAIGLLSSRLTVACLYEGGSPLVGVDATSSGCPNAAGSGLIANGTFRVDYLQPGPYAIRLYLTDSVYVSVPGLVNVTAGQTRILDLGSVLALLPLPL
jgi:hypothetical protein